MTKSELVDQVAVRAELPKQDAARENALGNDEVLASIDARSPSDTLSEIAPLCAPASMRPVIFSSEMPPFSDRRFESPAHSASEIPPRTRRTSPA